MHVSTSPTEPTADAGPRRGGARDRVLVLLGALFGAASLGYPLGHDTGSHFYVAREWIERGAIPYLHTFDHKTPDIYAIHALAMTIFGVKTYAVRPVELVTVLTTGWLLGGLVARGSAAPTAFAARLR
jgi:hypothetical protein